jgi:Carboxylesterase family
VLLAGCAGRPGLMPTPKIYVGDVAPPLFTGPPPPATSVDMFYVTDRAPVTKPDGSLAYSSDRSRSMAFGSVTVEIGEKVPWPVLAEQSEESPRELPLELQWVQRNIAAFAADALVNAPYELENGGLGILPVVDGTVLTQTPAAALASGQFNHVPVISGSTHDEVRSGVAYSYEAGTPRRL